jgi:O-antigen/teichoic acid export membrane protein
VVRGAGIATGAAVVQQTLTLAVYIALARLAPPSTFGTFAEASILVWFGGIFVESGMTAALIHRRDQVEEAAATALLSNLVGGVAITVLCAAVAPLLGLFFGSDEVAIIAAAIAPVHFLNSSAVVPEAMLQRRFSFVRRTIVDPITVILYGVTAAVAFSAGLGVWALVLAVYISEAAKDGLAWALVGWRPDFRRASWAMWRELAGYARYVITSEFMRQAGVMFNTAAIGRFLGTVDLAQYNFGSRIATQAPTAMVAAVGYVLFPALARISSDAERFRRAVSQSFRSGCFMAFPVSFILIPLGEPLSVLLFGERWRIAGKVIAVLAPVGAGLALRSISTEVFKAAGRPKILPRIYALSAILPALAVVVALPLGVVAIAGGVAATAVGVGLYSSYLAARVAELRPVALLKAIWIPTLASAAMVVALYALEHLAVHSDQRGVAVGLSLLGMEVLVGGGIYVGAVFVLDAAVVKEFVSSVSGAWSKSSRATSAPETTAVPKA